MVVSLATIPMLLSYFSNNEQLLGTWLAFFAFTSIVVSLDLGIGNRLKNDILGRVSSNAGYGDLIRESLSAQVMVSLAIALLVLGGGLVAWNMKGGGTELGRITQQHPELLILAVAFVVLSMPLRLSYFILQAQQRNAVSALMVLAPQMTVLLYAALAAKSSILPMTLPALASVLLVANISAYFVPFAFAHKMAGTLNNRERGLRFLTETQIEKLKAGLPFFLMQVSIIFLYSYNELFYLVAGTTVDIVHYQYYFRPFSLFSVGFSIISLPFWSAIRLSQLHNNVRRTRQIFAAIVLLNIPVAIALLPTVYFYQDILDIWLGAGVYRASGIMLIIFAVSSLLTCIMHALSSVLCGYDLIGFQAKALGGGLLVKAFTFFILLLTGGSIDPVMISTTVGLLFVVFTFSLKAYELWQFKSAN